MPPQRKKLTDDEKAKLFEDWQQGDEYRVINDFNKARQANPLIIGVDNATNDISEDWGEVCKQWFNLVEVLKVPGRKGKRKNFIDRSRYVYLEMTSNSLRPLYSLIIRVATVVSQLAYFLQSFFGQATAMSTLIFSKLFQIESNGRFLCSLRTRFH